MLRVSYGANHLDPVWNIYIQEFWNSHADRHIKRLSPPLFVYVRAVYTTWFCQHDSVIHNESCNVNSTMTPCYTVMYDFGIMHDKSWGIGLVLFAMTESCHFSQSTCRTLRLMSFQEKQEQGYTFSIHNIWFCRVAAQMCGLKWQRNSRSLVSNYMTRNWSQWMVSSISSASANPRSCPYPRPSPVSSYSENSTSNYYYT